jgi:hypothetical protein
MGKEAFFMQVLVLLEVAGESYSQKMEFNKKCGATGNDTSFIQGELDEPFGFLVADSALETLDSIVS